MKQMEKNMPIKIILARSCIFLGLDFYASISWGARAEEICRTIWVKAKISNSGSSESIKTIVRSCKCNLKLFKVRPSNACERKSIWTRPIDGKCYQQGIFFDQVPFLLVQRVPALRAFSDLEKTVLHETRLSGTILWSPTNANSPTYTYISQKTC